MDMSVERKGAWKDGLVSVLRAQGLLIAFLLLCVAISLISKEFASANNILLVLRQVSIVGVIACAVTLVLIVGHLDLSVGSIVSFTTVLSITLHDAWNPALAITATLAVGLVIGAINGWLIGYIRMNSLITTLGMLSVVAALTLIYTGGTNVNIANPDNTWFSFIGKGFLFGIPFPVILFAGIALVFGFVLKYSLYGRYLYAVGGNPLASEFAGIRTNRLVFSTYLLSGLMASVGGIMLASRLMSAQNSQGQGMELDVLAAVILGGTSLLGGSGSVFKTVIGVLILGFLQNGMIMMGLPYYTQWIATGLIIIGAVGLDLAINRRRS